MAEKAVNFWGGGGSRTDDSSNSDYGSKNCPHVTGGLSKGCYHYTTSPPTLEVNVMVQDYTWPGGLVVLRFVAENPGEFVIECAGWDEYGNQITRFLMVDKEWAVWPLRRFGQLGLQWALPSALSSDVYYSQGFHSNSLPLPYPPINSVSQSSASVHDELVQESLSSLWSLICML